MGFGERRLQSADQGGKQQSQGHYEAKPTMHEALLHTAWAMPES